MRLSFWRKSGSGGCVENSPVDGSPSARTQRGKAANRYAKSGEWCLRGSAAITEACPHFFARRDDRWNPVESGTDGTYSPPGCGLVLLSPGRQLDGKGYNRADAERLDDYAKRRKIA